MAHRSVFVEFQNQTSQTLTRTSFGLEGGIGGQGDNATVIYTLSGS